MVSGRKGWTAGGAAGAGRARDAAAAARPLCCRDAAAPVAAGGLPQEGPAMRRTPVFVALATVVLALLAGGAAAQDGTPAATPATADPETLVRAFYEPFTTGDVSVYDEILLPDWQ